MQDVDAGEAEEQCLPGLRSGFRHPFDAEKHAASCETRHPMPIAHNAEGTYPHKPVGQYVEQESSDKLTGIKGHHFSSVPVGIILPGKGYFPSLSADEAMIGESDPVGIPTKVLDHGFGAMEGRACNRPPIPLRRVLEEGREGFLERSNRSGEVKLLLFQEREDLPPEEARHYLDGQEKPSL